MSQWGQAQQPGYQYPLQTGFQGANPQFQQQNPQFQQQNPQFQQQNPQFQQQPGGFGGVGLVPQQTGFPGQRLQGFQQPQQSGFHGGPGFLQPQPTGFPAQGGNFQQQARAAPLPPPVPPLPAQFQQQNQASGFLGVPQQQQPQVNRFMSSSPGIGGPGLLSQPTGFPGRGGGGALMPQMTGFVDPRLQMMSTTFMPANSTSFGTGAAPQLAPPQFNLQQSFQQHNQAQRGTTTSQMPWALSKAEKKQYNDIFRSWDAQNTGFISGQTALEVFGASGLPKEDLARIWTLADIDDRGKLSIAEFHVAMGLIYRRLSGMPVPEQLPAELVPPSARDLDNSVDIMKDLLKHESRTRSPSGFEEPVSRLKIRSLNSSSSTLDSSRDATVYKHVDTEPPGGVYQPRSRHLNRDDVRSRNDEDNPSADLSDMKRRLANTAQMLERTAEADAARTVEDEELDREMDDLKYRVTRVSEDLEYVSRGPKTAAKDQERRKLERELLALMHEHIPEVERKIKARSERREREKRQWARDRDRANDRFGRYDTKDSPRRYDEEDRDRPYSRGYNRDDDRSDGDRSYRRNARSRSRDRDYDRPRSPPAVRSPPPPPAAPPSSIRESPAPPKSTPSPSPLKNMNAEERQAYARAEAKRRIEARMAALGVTSPSSPVIDSSVEDRLQQDKKEAEQKAQAADKQAEERERLRKERLENERAAKDGRTPPSPAPAAAPAPTPTRTIPTPTAPAPAPTPRSAPPAPKPRAPAPPPPRKASAVRQTPAAAPVVPRPPVAPPPPPEPEVDPEEERLRAREEAIKKQREARAERLRQLEREEAEAARLEEEKYQARLKALQTKSTSPPAPTFSPPAAPPAPKAPTPPPPAPAAPPPPPVVATSPATDPTKSTNPFSRLINQGATPSTTPPAPTNGNGNTNPWARPQMAPPPSAPTPPKSPGPKSYNTALSSSIEDDWDDVKENEEDDSSDDELSGRGKREDIARQLFGSILPTSRPQSAAPSTTATKPVSSPTTPAPPPPPSAPPAPLDAAPFAPPLAPPPPPAPVSASSPPEILGDVSGLMRSIQGGLKLRPTKTTDKSAPPVSGRVLGDAAPPAHISTVARAASPPRPVEPPTASEYYEPYLPEPTPMDESSSKISNRQSVGWFAERAADAGREVQRLPSTNEEEEEMEETGAYTSISIPAIHIKEPTAESVPDPLEDIDKSIRHRARSLYAYEGDGPDDLSFGENLILTANPSKSGGDWWHGTLVGSGKSGLFPKTYVEVVKPIKVKALYTYTGNNSDELPFTEGDELTVIDRSEEEWWKAEQDGVVFIVPAAYLEVVEDPKIAPSISLTDNESVKENMNEVTTPVLLSNPPGVELGQGEQESETSSTEDGDSDYLSFDEDVEEEYPETKADREARARERQLVLQAAGLIVTQDDKLPPKIVRARSMKRRPAPPAPAHLSRTSLASMKELPSVPQPEQESDEPVDHARRLDDAFERYESFKNTQGNRMSVASSMETMSSSPTAPSFSTAPSRDSEVSKGYSGFLHFLGRSKTPDGERRTTLNISAPIMNNSENTSRSASPAFGTSWASLVDKAALDGLSADERRRQEAIFELINTEGAYVRDLQLIVEVFYSSMLPLLSRKEVTVIFANIEDILLTNTTFLSVLEERQKECRLYVDRIGDILMNHIPNTAMYMTYCVNQNAAIKVLKSLRDSNPDLAAHLQNLRDNPAVRNLDLSSYLLVPMQRITRYPLLIRQILTHTNVQNEREDVQSALELAEKILGHINEAIRDQEGHETLKTLSQYLWIGQGRLDLTAPTRYMGPRKLIKEGALIKAKSGRKLYGFLCSDILVLTDESMKTLYRMPIPLAQAHVRDSSKDDLTFEVSQAFPRGGDAIALKAVSIRDCQAWMHEIEYAGRRCRHAEDRAIRKQRKALN